MSEVKYSDLSHWCERGVHTRCRDYDLIERSHQERVVDGVSVIFAWKCNCLCHTETK